MELHHGTGRMAARTNITYGARTPGKEAIMAHQIRIITTLKLPTKFMNNIYLGGPLGPSDEDLQALKSLASQSRTGGGSNQVKLKVHLMQKSYANPAEKPTQEKLPDMPEPNSTTYSYYVYKEVDVTEGTILFDCLNDFVAEEDKKDNLWSAIDAQDPYLKAFYRGADEKYGSTGAYFKNNEKVTGKLQDGEEYTWKGWGVMYNPGEGAPTSQNTFEGKGSFELGAMFTDKTLAEQTVRPMPGNSYADDKGYGYNVYTFIYAQTEYKFKYSQDNVYLILRDRVEEVEEITEEALLKSKELFEKAERGIVELMELVK